MFILCISGKSGCRRIVPGQYQAIDPKGRAVMIGAVEKQKLVYILNRDSNVSPICAALHLTGFSSEIGTKLRDWAVGQAWGSCYSWAALSSNDSKTL